MLEDPNHTRPRFGQNWTEGSSSPPIAGTSDRVVIMRWWLIVLICCLEACTSINLRMPPEFQTQIDKLNATETKVRKQIQLQSTDLIAKKATLSATEEKVREELKEVSGIGKWIARAQKGIDQITKAKEAVHVRYDLQRLRPFMKLAASKREKLKSEALKVSSAHKEVADRVSRLENQLKGLQAVTLQKEEQVQGEAAVISSSGGSPGASGASSTDPDTAAATTVENAKAKEEEEKLKTAEGTLDDLLQELDDGR